MNAACYCLGLKSVVEVYPEPVGRGTIIIDEALVENGLRKRCKVKCHQCGQVSLQTLTFLEEKS